MNKIKDFLYDISDLLLSLAIIAIIFSVVSFKLTDTMALTWFSDIDNIPESMIKQVASTLPDTTLPAINNTDENVVTEIEEPVEVEPVVPEIMDIEFIIEPGTPGYKIAKNLYENNLIPSTDDFIHTLDDMSLTSKLRAGTFKLNTGMTVVEIINKLTGN